MEHKMCVLIFSTDFIQNISHSKKNSARYYHKRENVFISCTRYSRRILMKQTDPRDFLKNRKYQVSSKSVQSEPSSMRTE
jgi:hypothetical protein